MYEITVKGKTITTLKEALIDLSNELCSQDKKGTDEFGYSSTEDKITRVEETVVVDAIGETLIAPMTATQIDESLKPLGETIAKHAEVIMNPMIEVATKAIVSAAESDLDAEGITWDERVHTNAKTKTVKGVWKSKRGCDKNLLAQIKNEQKGAPVSTPVAPVVDVVAPAPVVEAPVVAPINTGGGHTSETFIARFPMVMAGLIEAGTIDQEYVNTLNTHFNVAQIWEINDDQKGALFTAFVNAGFVTQVG